MKKIKLVQNKFTIVDDEDYENLSQYTWLIKNVYCSSKVYRIGVNLQMNKLKMFFLHREIMKISDPAIQVIHLNGDYLDNQKKNLHIISQSEKQMFQKNLLKQKTLEGVFYLHSNNKYIATVSKDNIEFKLGTYRTQEEAGMAYDKAAIELYGDDVLTNKKKGLIDYCNLNDIKITFSNTMKTVRKTTHQEKLIFIDLMDRINELKKKYNYKELSELLNLSSGDLSNISNGRRKITMEKVINSIAIIKEKKL